MLNFEMTEEGAHYIIDGTSRVVNETEPSRHME